MMAKVKEALEELKPFTDLGACTFAESETEDKDWINNWKQYFKPFTVVSHPHQADLGDSTGGAQG